MKMLINNSTLKEKSSKFISYLYQIDNENDYLEILENLKKEHSKASHILKLTRYKNKCDVLIELSSEDKEPVSSMKRLKEISILKNYYGFALFIVRYFGGKKLGASNLDRLYFNIGCDNLKLLNKGEYNGK